MKIADYSSSSDTFARLGMMGLISLAFILLIALALRAPFISSGLPYFYDEDEAHHFNRTVNMVKSGDLDPHYFHKPSLHFYLRIPVVAASFLWNVRSGHIRSVKEIRTADDYGLARYAFTASHVGIVKWNRAYSVFFSLLVVGLAFLITFELTSLPFAIIAGTLTALSPALVEHAATIGVDGIVSAFCLLGGYVGLKLFRRFSLSGLLCCGLICGFAISTKYNALPIYFFPLAVIFLSRNVTPATATLALTGPVLGFLAGSPYILSSLPLFLDHFGYEVWHYGVAGHVGHTAEPGLPQALHYLNWIKNDGIGLFASITAAVCVIAICAAPSRRLAAIFFFPALYFLLMISQRANFTRNMLVFIPYLSVLVGVGLFVGKKWISFPDSSPTLRRVAITSLPFLLFLQPLLDAYSAGSQVSTYHESRAKAARWLSETTPSAPVAIAGKLQLPPAMYQIPGVDRFDHRAVTGTELILQGFKRAMTFSHATAGFSDLHWEPTIKFDGALEEQRIIRNPAITVLSLKDLPAQDFVQLFGERASEFHFNFVRSQPNILQLPCSESWENSPEAERHCWLDSRLTRLSFAPGLQSISGRSLEVEIFTPWENQQVSIVREGSGLQQESPLPASTWTTLRIKDFDFRGNYFIVLSEVRSPATQGMSPDLRRLGIALRSATIQ